MCARVPLSHPNKDRAAPPRDVVGVAEPSTWQLSSTSQGMEVEEWRAARREELGEDEPEVVAFDSISDLGSSGVVGGSSVDSGHQGGHGVSSLDPASSKGHASGRGGGGGAAASLQGPSGTSIAASVSTASHVSVGAAQASLADCRLSSSTTSSSMQPSQPRQAPATVSNASRPVSAAAASCSSTSYSSTNPSKLAASSATVSAAVAEDESPASKVDAPDHTSASVQADWDLSEVFPEGPSLEDLRVAIAAGKDRPMVSPGRSKAKRRTGRHVRRDVWS